MNKQLIFATLGPVGTCHELATQSYIEFQEVANAKIELFNDLLDALELLHDGKVDFIIQNSAHPKVYELTEKYFREVFVIDSFLCPTHAMGLLTRRDVENPCSLGLMPATRAYVNTERYSTFIHETAKPVVGQNLLAGKYDSGIAALQFAEENPDVVMDALPPSPPAAQAPAPVFECVRWSWSSDRLLVWCLQWRERKS